MCGASSQQTQTYDEQQNFFKTLMSEQNTAWGKDQEVLNAIKSVSEPIFAAGPSQEGFAPQEKAALETGVTEDTAAAYKQASQAVGGKLATLGGGNLPGFNGATAQIQGDIATGAARTEALERGQITSADYEQGYKNWLQAGSNMFGVSSGYSPTSFAGVANQAGSGASQTANEIAQESNSWMQAAAGIGGAVIGENPHNVFG